MSAGGGLAGGGWVGFWGGGGMARDNTITEGVRGVRRGGGEKPCSMTSDVQVQGHDVSPFLQTTGVPG